MKKQIKKELEATFSNYLEAYFSDRDMPGTYSLMSNTLSGFGTGIDENAYSGKAFRELYKRDFEQAPNPITFKLKKTHTQVLHESIGIVSGQLNINTTIMEQSLKLNDLRISAVFQKTDSVWLLEHMHISFPTAVHEADEAYPLKEIEERATVLEKLVQERTKELEQAHTNLEKLAEIDPMTGMFNRMKMDNVLNCEIQRAQRYQTTFSVLLFDLDNFKEINDTRGHQAGDKVLSELATVIRQRVRNTDVIGRWGGDEFLIISPETNLEDAALLAETIRISLSTHKFDNDILLTSSFGVSTWLDLDSHDTLIDRADKALYKAKRSGKDQVIN
ncbi:MAG: diguanylate cyclase [Anaerolineaceae bacterium]|nr:diguanylate cyclase [Anaerolineaceae bacterium]